VAGNHVAVVNEDGPDLNADEEEHVEVLLHGAEVDENTVRVSREFQLLDRSTTYW
jgi:hypothetical protein